MNRRLRRAAILSATLALSTVVVAGLALAAVPGEDGAIHGCYQVRGALRVIDPSIESCTKSETAIEWAQTGPAGPAGPTGAAGPAGSPGPAGLAASSIWAVVEPGFAQPPDDQLTLAYHGSHLTTVTEDAGEFRLVFDQAVSQCGYAAAVREQTYNAILSARPDGANTVVVVAKTSDGTRVRTDFSLIVAC